MKIELKDGAGKIQQTVVTVSTPISAEHEVQPGSLNLRILRKLLDGSFIGKDGELFDPKDGLKNAPPHSLPGQKQTEAIIYVNGIGTSPVAAYKHMRFLAQNFNLPVHGIYNSSSGIVRDLVQCLGDKLNIGMNSAVKTLTNELTEILRSGSPVKLMAHSQGALIVSRALKRSIRALEKEDFSSEQLGDNLKKVEVTTLGGAAWSYPNGPKYVHYVNLNDPVPINFGVATYGLTRDLAQRLVQQAQKSVLVRTLMTGLNLINSPIKESTAGKGAAIERFLCRFGNNSIHAHRASTYIQWIKNRTNAN